MGLGVGVIFGVAVALWGKDCAEDAEPTWEGTTEQDGAADAHPVFEGVNRAGHGGGRRWS